MNIGKRQAKAILAMKPGVCATKRSQISLVAQGREPGQRGFRHRDGLDRLLIVLRFFFSVGIPIAVSDRPEDVFLAGGHAVQKIERNSGHVEKIVLRPAAGRQRTGHVATRRWRRSCATRTRANPAVGNGGSTPPAARPQTGQRPPAIQGPAPPTSTDVPRPR